MLNWHLSPLMTALVDAAERLGGGGDERAIEAEAARRGESGRYGAKAHFAKGIRELADRGIFRTEKTISGRSFWLTDEAWADRGHKDPPPRSNQMGLL